MVSFDNASMPYKMVTANSFEMADFIRAVTKEALPGGRSHVAHLNFKMSRVGVYKCLSLIVAIWQREVVSCRNFILHAVATF